MIDRANVLLMTVFDASGRLRDRLSREEGQAFVEYAMVLLLVTVALAAGTFITPFRDAHRGRIRGDRQCSNRRDVVTRIDDSRGANGRLRDVAMAAGQAGCTGDDGLAALIRQIGSRDEQPTGPGPDKRGRGSLLEGPRPHLTKETQGVTRRSMVHRLSSERGQALVELVIALPLIFGLVFLIAYAGVGFNRYLQVTDAARIGARAAAVARFNSSPQLSSDPCTAATDCGYHGHGRAVGRRASPAPAPGSRASTSALR